MEILNLNQPEYSGQTIRICTLLDGQKAASLYDVVGAAGLKNPREAIAGVQEKLSGAGTTSKDFQTHQFPGQGQRITPVATAAGLVKILMLLPGQKAAAFREKASAVLVRYLGGDEALVNEIRANAATAESNPASIQAFAATSSARKVNERSEADLEMDREERRERLKRMRIETAVMEQEAKSRIEAANMNTLKIWREAVAELNNPLEVMNLNDAITNQMRAAISQPLIGNGGVGDFSSSAEAAAIEAAPATAEAVPASASASHMSIDELLMQRAANYNRISTDAKKKLGALVARTLGTDRCVKIPRYVNGSNRSVNAYPAELSDAVWAICLQEGATARM